ncbi:Tyrosine-protein kinase Drl [Eufriesea mexicana]|nr:Tyrosine-protein kinase Drl [Eufriesea mexicana]
MTSRSSEFSHAKYSFSSSQSKLVVGILYETVQHLGVSPWIPKSIAHWFRVTTKHPVALHIEIRLEAELYYVREGVVNKYAMNFVVPVPAYIADLEFSWQSLAGHPCTTRDMHNPTRSPVALRGKCLQQPLARCNNAEQSKHVTPVEMVTHGMLVYVPGTELTYNELEALLRQAINETTPYDWKEFCKHVETLEHEYWTKDGIIEDATEDLELEIQSSESDKKSDDNSSKIYKVKNGSNGEVPYRKLSDSIINFPEGVAEEEEEQERGTGWWMSRVIVKIAAPVMLALSDHLISA